MVAIDKAKELLNDVGTYWKTPPKGRYMNYKEIVSFAGGQMGVRLIVQCIQAMLLSVGNVLIGNVIGIPPEPLYAIYIISIIASFPLTGLRANIIDNTKSKKGKYRPYILSMGIPSAILAIAFVWMPYEIMNLTTKCVVVLLFNIAFQFFYMFFYDVNDNLINVLSPNTQERAEVNSIRYIVESFAPSILSIVTPLLGKLITGKDTMTDIRIYRYVYPGLIIFGAVLAVLVYANTEEKIIQAKTHVVQIKFIDAFRAVARNKYFWIISFAGWLGFLESSCSNIMLWLYNYQHATSAGAYALITALYGNASLWGMLFAPFAIKRMGKRNLLIFTNLLNIIFIALLYPSITMAGSGAVIWLVLCCLWMNALAGSFSRILTPSINGDIRDYQQYVTGERIDGMFAAVGLIGSVITMLLSGVLPKLYSTGGMNSTKLAEMLPQLLESGAVKSAEVANVYDVLYDSAVFEYAMGILIGASVIGAIMNVIPFFFYDLTEIKQRGMINILKIRAMFEDFGNGLLEDKDIVEVIDIINESKECAVAQKRTISKDKIMEAKTHKVKSDIKATKKQYRADIEFNKNIEISNMVMDELNKFNTTAGQAQLEAAKIVYASGISGIMNTEKHVLKIAKQLPKQTEKEKAFRKAEIAAAHDIVYARKTISKYYPDGIRKFDMSVFDKLFERDDKITQAKNVAYKKSIDAQESKDRDAIAIAKSEIKMLKTEQKAIKKAIKIANNENAIYHRAAKPYLDAKNLLSQSENYKNYNSIEELYEEAKKNQEAAIQAKKEAEMREKKEKAEYAQSLKDAKKNNKK